MGSWFVEGYERFGGRGHPTAWLTGAKPQAKRPVEPVLGASARFKLPAYAYGQNLVFCIPLFCMIRSQIQI